MVIKLQNILSFIKEKYPLDGIILIGDFNMVNIIWKYDHDFVGFLLPTEVNLNIHETEFL